MTVVPPPQAALNMAGKAFFGSLCAGTFGLGVWQAQRLVEKQDLQRQRHDDLAMDPIDYKSNNAEDIINNKHHQKQQSSSFRRYRLQGRFHHDREFLVGPRGPPAGALPDAPGTSAKGMSSAPQGYFVIAPLEILPQNDRDSVDELATTKGSSTSWIGSWFRRTTAGNPQEAAIDDDESASATTSASSFSNYVLVNRGWVPRNMVSDDTRQGRNNMRPSRPTQQSSDLFQWDRPTGTVQVVGVATDTEHPKYLVADHQLSSRPPKLYWFDAPTMKAVAGVPLSAPYFTVVRSTESNSSSGQLPLAPTADKLAEFKVTPAVHAGYAFTWFGLSAAGMYMTRKLITRGR